MAYPAQQPQPLPEAQRSAILDQTLMSMAASSPDGFRVEYRVPTSAVVVRGKPVNTVAHLLATVFLCGLWLPIWIITEVTGGEKRSTISIDEWGRALDGLPRAGSSNGASQTTVWVLSVCAVILLVLILVAIGGH